MAFAKPRRASEPQVIRDMRRKRWEDSRDWSARSLYDAWWRKARAAFIAANPFCVMCAREGRDALAGVVDHIVPHKGNVALFRDPSNWQGLCLTCHNSSKQSQERLCSAVRSKS